MNKCTTQPLQAMTSHRASNSRTEVLSKREQADASRTGAVKRKLPSPDTHPSDCQYSQSLKKQKMFLSRVFGADTDYILQHVQEESLVTDRDYKNLMYSCSLTGEDKAIRLLDLLREKGEETCGRFLRLLQTNTDIIKQFPKLADPPWDHVPVPLAPPVPPAPGRTSELTDWYGYIHDVSKQKSGPKKKYFNAILQNEKESHKVTVFPLHTQDQFASAEKDGSPVKLGKVLLQSSLQRRNRMEIKFMDRSTLTVLPAGCLSYSRTTDHSLRAREVSLADLQEDQEKCRNRQVNLVVNLLQKVKCGHRKTRSGKYLLFVEYIAADATSKTTLSVWGEETLLEGKWYKITNVSVGFHNSSVVLNTTSESVCHLVSDRGKPAGVHLAPLHTFTGTIIGADVSVEYTCPQLHLVNEDKTVKIVRCEACSLSYLHSNLKMILRGTVSVETNGGNERLQLEDKDLRGLLGDGRTSSKEQLEEALVLLPPVTVTTNNGCVLSISVAENQEAATG